MLELVIYVRQWLKRRRWANRELLFRRKTCDQPNARSLLLRVMPTGLLHSRGGDSAMSAPDTNYRQEFNARKSPLPLIVYLSVQLTHKLCTVSRTICKLDKQK